jgi:hypothetical protein
MPVLARCPMCRAVLPAGSADAPGEVRCPRCAEMVVPAARKFCARCSRDVTRERRMKDAAGEYYCPDCWPRRAAEAGTQVEDTFRPRRDVVPDALISAASDPGTENTTAQLELETFSQHQARQRQRRYVRVALWVAGAVAVGALLLAVALYF